MNLDHVNIRTNKLAESVRFYEHILGLTSGERPAVKVGGAWLYSGAHPNLHLIESTAQTVATGPLDHVAFASSGLKNFLNRLEGASVPRVIRKVPGDSVVQVQFLDPNRVVIEVNFADEFYDGAYDAMDIDPHATLTQADIQRRTTTKLFRSNNVSTAYDSCGNGPPLILIHGREAGRKSFASILPALADHFTCITYDQRDTGDTKHPAEPYSMSDLADDAAALARHLGGSAFVWGTSFGGMIAQELAMRHPDCVRRLVLSVTFQRGAAPLADPERFLALRSRAATDSGARHELLSLYFSPISARDRPELITGLQQVLTTRAPEAAARREIASQGFNSEGRASAIKSRTLVLGAMQDRVIAPFSSWKLAQEIPNATLTMLDGTGHALTLEHPDRVAASVTHYLGYGVSSTFQLSQREGDSQEVRFAPK